MYAAENGHKDIVDALIGKKCNLDLRDKNGFTAVMKAADKGHMGIVEVLLAHKCNLDLRNNKGRTALGIAKRRDDDEIVELIENQLYRNRNWDRRRDLMLVLARRNYLLPSSSSLTYPTAAKGKGKGRVGRRVVKTPVIKQRVDAALMTSSGEKVLCNMFLVHHIMRYI